MNASQRTGVAAPSKSTRRHVLVRASLAALLLSALVAAGYLPRWKQRAAVRADTLELAIPTVRTVNPTPGTDAGLLLPAEISPFADAPVYARATGYLKRRLVDIGDRVRTGQLLAEIDAPELARELDRNRAELAQVEAALALAKTTAARWADLVQTASVTEQENAERQADVALKFAASAAARANVRRLEELENFTRVRAPFAGVVTARKVDLGDLVTAGAAKELFRVSQASALRVFVHVPQSLAHGIEPGLTAVLAVPELPSRQFVARVVRTSGAMSGESRTMLVELAVDNSRGEILAGSFGQVRFSQTRTAPRLTLPASTLQFRPEGPSVAVVASDGVVEVRSVKLGRDLGPTVEILSGVTASDRVVLSPPDSLATGSRVRLASGVASRKLP